MLSRSANIASAVPLKSKATDKNMSRVVKIEGMEMCNGLSDPDTGQTEGGVGVLQRPETSRQEPGDKDRYAHYVSAHRLATSRLTGQPVVALCGKVWVPTRELRRDQERDGCLRRPRLAISRSRLPLAARIYTGGCLYLVLTLG